MEKNANSEMAEEKPNILTLLIKLSAAQNGRAESLIGYEWKTLLENCCFSFNEGPDAECHLRKSVKTFYEEDVVETETLIKFDAVNPDANYTLPLLAQRLVRSWCEEMGHGLHDQPRLEILNPDAYVLKCTQTHPRIMLNGFSLGNFINFGTFIEHYCLNMMHRVRDTKNLLDKGVMEAHFEHDIKKLMVSFTLGEFSAQRGRTAWHLYRMTLDYNGIHSVVVDYSERNFVALYLILKYTPKIVIDEPKDANDRQMHREIKNYSKRTHNYFRIAEVLNWGKKLGRCSAIKFVYPLHGDDAQKAEALDDFWSIISRLKYRAKCHVYFLAVRTEEGREIASEDYVSHDMFSSFSSYYLLRALLSRGYAVHDQFDDKFATVVARASHQNPLATEKALEMLLSAVDEHRYISLLNAFSKIYTEFAMRTDNLDAQILGGDDETEIPRNCVKVRKLIVTPTRELLMPPEVMMANRVLRRFGEDYAFRLLFRDEDGQKIRADRLQKNLFEQMVSNVMLNGRKYGDRHYKFLAWSNSQLRDHGCYMYCTTPDNEDIAFIRRWMGDFTACSNVPKYMSRMGQCFTQAQEAVRIPYDPNSNLVKIEGDVMCDAKHPETQENYVFSDGIGRLSLALAKKVCEQLELDQPTPSAYQIRYAGCKGMLSVDVRLDKNPQGPQLILRDSMKKFDSDQSYVLEIVKYSQPSPVYLNRPLVMILDQVSARQGTKTFQRVTNMIHRLLEKELFSMAEMLLSESASVEALVSRTPLGIDFNRLKNSGFPLTSEPFFRGLLLAIHHYTLKSQLFKAKIEIPLDQGRTMYGIMDESGVLQYGQVFVQYSTNVREPGENLKVLKGRVMVTKNPCLVPGDVRLFTAVYKKALAHLHDVIVFPRNGPRPHTDEMAGSDLDGDEYAVYWDLSLMFDRNEEAMTYPKAKPDPIPGGVKDQDMVEFFHRYIHQDCIGTVSIAHLVYADRHGLFDPACKEIARKCSTAVDFPKTGKQAEKLTEAEMPYRYPDYMQKDHRPMYRSRRLLGQLYRKIKIVSDTVELSRNETYRGIHMDPDLVYPGWEEYKDRAIEKRNEYVHHLQALMDQYGIQDESQLVSGHMVSIRNRVSDGEKEDFSFFNTEKIVELRIHKIFEKFRRQFFDDFGGERDDLIQSPTSEVQQKASAYYVATYDPNETGGTIKMLSFPWLVWDILTYIKLHRFYERNAEGFSCEPIQQSLQDAIDKFNGTAEVHGDRQRLLRTVLERAHDLKYVLKAYGHPFCHVLFVILRWCEKEKVFRTRALNVEHVAMLLYKFACGLAGRYSDADEPDSYIEKFETLKTEQENPDGGNVANFSRPLYRAGALALGFIKYLSSQHFRCQKILDFTTFCNLQSRFQNREWYYLNSVAFKTYHHIAWTAGFKSLHLTTPTAEGPSTIKWDRDELDPIPIQITDDSPLYNDMRSNYERGSLPYCKLLEEWSGMDEVKMRFDRNCYDQNQWLVVGAGSLEARNKLKEILLSDDLQDSLYDRVCPPNLRED